MVFKGSTSIPHNAETATPAPSAVVGGREITVQGEEKIEANTLPNHRTSSHRADTNQKKKGMRPGEEKYSTSLRRMGGETRSAGGEWDVGK